MAQTFLISRDALWPTLDALQGDGSRPAKRAITYVQSAFSASPADPFPVTVAGDELVGAVERAVASA